MRECIAAVDLLAEMDISADVWSVTSFNELRKEALLVERDNMLNPLAKPKRSYLQQCLDNTTGPIIAATDYMKINSDQLRPFIERRYVCLGTDGFGRSDTRENLRHHFEVNSFYIAYAAVKALVDDGQLDPAIAVEAQKKWGIDPNKPAPINE